MRYTSSFVNLIYEGRFIGALGLLIAVIFSIILHELAHGYVAKLNGDNTAKYAGRLTLNPIKHLDPFGFVLMLVAGFGWAKPVPVNSLNFRSFRKGLFTVAIAGICVNLILAFIFCPILLVVIKSLSMNEFIFEFLLYLSYGFYAINLILVVFNLIPVYPLDGFRIIESLTRHNNPYTKFMYKYGRYILLGIFLITYITGVFFNFSIISILADYLGWPIRQFWGLIL